MPPEKIATAARRIEGSGTTVSRETVRRLLIGQTFSDWARVELVLRAMCLLANQDPDRRRWSPSEDRYGDDDASTCIEHLRLLWNNAVDDLDSDNDAVPPPLPHFPLAPPAAPQPSQRKGWGTIPQSSPSGPWATGQPQKSASNYGEEPPL